MDDLQLQSLWQRRQFYNRVVPLSQPLDRLMKHTLAKRVRQLSALVAAWDELIPQSIGEHTALEGFSRGVLTVKVDSAAHRFQLRTLLDGGLMKELQARVPAALNKVRLLPGQFHAVDLAGAPRYEF